MKINRTILKQLIQEEMNSLSEGHSDIDIGAMETGAGRYADPSVQRSSGRALEDPVYRFNIHPVCGWQEITLTAAEAEDLGGEFDPESEGIDEAVKRILERSRGFEIEDIEQI